ncbi:MAG: hypothetical protein ACYCZ1_02500 [Candidatus Humimicrobiaceae bacterium]
MGIEDEIKLEDVLKEPNRLVIAKTFLQAMRTNGSIKRLDCENEDRKTEIKELRDEVKDKIGLKTFNKIAVIVTVILSIIMLLSAAVGILNIIFGK